VPPPGFPSRWPWRPGALPPPVPGRRRRLSRRRGPLSRTEVEAERQRDHEETRRAIDILVAEFHALLPREQAHVVGAIYARYSSRYQHSVADQVRGCLEAAVQQRIFVPAEHVFFDLAVRGAKQRRPDLNRLKEALAAKAVKAVLILTTNRLFRKTYKSLQFVEEEVVGRGVRCHFVKSGVDTADEKRWRMLLNNFAAIDEFVTSMYADNIRVAQEGLFKDKLVCGTITFGYRAREVAGTPTRQKRPRCEYAIDPETARRGGEAPAGRGVADGDDRGAVGHRPQHGDGGDALLVQVAGPGGPGRAGPAQGSAPRRWPVVRGRAGRPAGRSGRRGARVYTF
jgi:DNA invertase Pin-like site-specific DNA recombinase